MQYSQHLEGCQPERRKLVDTWLQTVQRTVWPTTCVLCRRPGQLGRDLCIACEHELPFNEPSCRHCAEPLAATSQAQICGRCLRRVSSVARCLAPLRYHYPVDGMIQALKYGRRLCVARVLGDVLAQFVCTRVACMPELILPVPLSRRRFRARGYNQAHEIAWRVALRTGIPWRTDVVERFRETKEQAGLPRSKRRRNVKHAFRLIRPLPAARIAIIDDVVTTGSTVEELARVLRLAGAEHIEVWAVARAGRSQ